jgi:hypothetical protein
VLLAYRGLQVDGTVQRAGRGKPEDTRP